MGGEKGEGEKGEGYLLNFSLQTFLRSVVPKMREGTPSWVQKNSTFVELKVSTTVVGLSLEGTT